MMSSFEAFRADGERMLAGFAYFPDLLLIQTSRNVTLVLEDEEGSSHQSLYTR